MNTINPQNDSREYPGMITSQSKESKDVLRTMSHNHNIETE